MSLVELAETGIVQRDPACGGARATFYRGG